eukprot:SM000068S20584  [mRNA]  locus=s68:312454:315178:+ [translate_table: standard]
MISIWMSFKTTTFRSSTLVVSYTMLPKMTPVSVEETLIFARICLLASGPSRSTSLRSPIVANSRQRFCKVSVVRFTTVTSKTISYCKLENPVQLPRVVAVLGELSSRPLEIVLDLIFQLQLAHTLTRPKIMCCLKYEMDTLEKSCTSASLKTSLVSVVAVTEPRKKSPVRSKARRLALLPALATTVVLSNNPECTGADSRRSNLIKSIQQPRHNRFSQFRVGLNNFSDKEHHIKG